MVGPMVMVIGLLDDLPPEARYHEAAGSEQDNDEADDDGQLLSSSSHCTILPRRSEREVLVM